MKELRDILDILSRIIVEIGHWLGIVYIPEVDAAPWPFEGEKEKAPIKTGNYSIPEGLRNMQYGEDTPDKAAKRIQIINRQVSESEWDIIRFDGVGGPNFQDWHWTDDDVIRRRKFTQVTAENYIKVRPLVISGQRNPQIAQAFGMKERWADTYAGAVREAFRLRMAMDDDSSPINERGDQVGETPQMTANIHKPA